MKYTKAELQKMWSRSQEKQISVAISKIIEAFRDTDGNISISWSGGKDSTVVLYLASMAWVSIYRDRPMVVSFFNTSNEHREILQFIPWFLDWLAKETGVVIDFHHLKQPKGNDFVTVMREEGLPLVSKQTARKVRKIRKYLGNVALSWSDVEQYHKFNDRHAVSELKAAGLNDDAVLILTGYVSSGDVFARDYFLPYRWAPIVPSKIPISDICCDRIKKDIAASNMKELGIHAYMTGEMACDSRQREKAYLQTGCNSILDGVGLSKPLGPVQEQTILWYIDTRQIPQSTYYGDLCRVDGHRCFTRHQRGGCALCGFGIEHEPDRYAKLYEEDYPKCRIGFLPVEKGGLGFGEACKYLNEYCGTNTIIPEIGE